MNPNKIKRLFKYASPTFIKLNSDNANDTGVSCESEQMDREWISETSRGEEVREVDRKCFVSVEFFAGHGQKLDEDNRRYIAKPILDALVNLGFSKSDKLFKSEVTQRMD